MNATLGVGVMAASLARSLSYAIAGSGGMATANAVQMLTLCTVAWWREIGFGADVAPGDLVGSSPPAALIYAADRFTRRAFGCCRAFRRVSRTVRNSAAANQPRRNVGRGRHRYPAGSDRARLARSPPSRIPATTRIHKEAGRAPGTRSSVRDSRRHRRGLAKSSTSGAHN